VPQAGWLAGATVCPVSDLDLADGREWAERQCEKASIGYTALDNGVPGLNRPRALQQPRPSRCPGLLSWQARSCRSDRLS
jgi:hypothetical protein